MTFNDYKAYRHILKPLWRLKKWRESRIINSYEGLLGQFCIILILMGIIMFRGCESPAMAYSTDIIEGYSLNQWANAIHKAEGNNNYGILSVSCTKGSECRRICKRTVWNNYKRWVRTGETGTYIHFLARRYCPIGASNDLLGRNKFWIKNVNYWLMRG